MASFVEGVLIIGWIEPGEQFTLNLKDGLWRSTSPELADDKRRKYSVLNVTLTDRNSSLTSSITLGRYKRGYLVRSTKRTSWRDGADSPDMKLFKNAVGPE